eukprot:TRINITY_DN33771_c0_g1_i1.p1 TRINITY_DN33771_c0_g1~~TRINITY_DN33771_c0_g1_i1.p1  ORF type:complete len:1387 (-),score=430.78 TRINITY_DN33771_c0_g1_i1:373-4095(-)
MAALSLRPEVAEDNAWMRGTEDRVVGLEQEFFELRSRVDELPGVEHADADVAAKLPQDDLEDMRHRLEWIEEQVAAGAASEKSNTKIGQVHNTVCDLVEQVSRLKQQAASFEAASQSAQNQVQQLQGLIERRQSEDSASLSNFGQVEAKVGAVSQQVADIAARLLEVEGNQDFARENETGLGEVSSLSAISEANHGSRGLPPLPKTEAEHAPSKAGAGLQEKLEAVAKHLEIVDDLADRIQALEIRIGGAAGSDLSQHLGGASPGPPSEVSFGGDAPIRTSSFPQADGSLKELGDLAVRLGTAEQELKGLREALSREELQQEKLRVGAQKREVEHSQEISKKLSDLEAKIEKSKQGASIDLGDELLEVKNELGDLQDQVSSALKEFTEGLGKARSEAEEKIYPIAKEVKELQAQLSSAKSPSQRDSKASNAADLENSIQEVRSEVANLGKSLEASKKESQGYSERFQDIEEKLERTEGLEELKASLESLSKKQTSFSADVEKQISSLQKSVKEDISELQEDLEKEVEAVSKKITEATQTQTQIKLDAGPSSKDVDGLRGKFQDFESKVSKDISELRSEIREEVKGLKASGGGASPSADIQKLEAKLSALEAKVGSSGNALGSIASSEDLKVRSEVQEQVKELTAQLSKELADLADHQKDMVQTRATVEALAAKAEKQGSQAPAQAGLDKLQTELANVVKRLAAAEKSTEETKKELESLLGPRNKVGISLGGTASSSPLSEVKGRLDILFEQVAELQNRSDHDDSSSGRVTRKSPSDKPRRRDASPSFDGSLNFSLTEQTERPAMGGTLGDGSLNFSLTEQTRQDMSVSEGPAAKRPIGLAKAIEADEELEDFDSEDDVPSVGPSPAASSRQRGGDTLDNLVQAGTTKNEDKDKSDGRPRPAAIKTSDDKLDRTLESVAEDISGTWPGSNTSLTSDAGKKGKSPIAGKSPVASGKSPLSPPSGSLARSPAAVATGKSPTASSVAESPMGGSGGILEASMVSASCNEVSIGGDYSVEDSLELEKCDHVEAVKPSGRDTTPTKSKAIGVAGATIAEGPAEEEEEDISVSSASLSKDSHLKSPASASSSPSKAAKSPSAARTLMEESGLLKPKAGIGGGGTDILDSFMTKAKAKVMSGAGGTGGGGDALDSLLGGKTSSKGLASPAKSASASSALSPAASSSGVPTPKAKAKGSPKAELNSKSPGDDDEYGDESFEDHMSVPESIEEDVDGSGSGDAWGSGEAV